MIGLDMPYPICNGEQRNCKFLFFLGSLSVTAQDSTINNLFGVTHLENSSPVENATIELYDVNQKFLWKGETDTEGVVESSGWKEPGLKVTDAWSQPWVFASVSFVMKKLYMSYYL